MYAVVEIAGQQYKVSPATKYVVPKLEAEAGAKVSFDKVLLISDEKTVKVGTPAIAGMTVEATVLGHMKDDKVIVFKKKRRKGYRVKRGHREQYTEIEVNSIA